MTQYLSDMYLKSFHCGVEEARAVATYLLWEAKDRDPNVGKQSDIAVIQSDGKFSRLANEELAYWEDHFRVLKRELSILPILSCATSVTKEIYGVEERLERLNLAVKILASEQQKLRAGKPPSPIDKIFIPKLREQAAGWEKRKAQKSKPMQSDAQRSEDQQ